VLWECGYGDLIRADFYRLFAFPAGVTGHLLDAGCGTGVEVVNLQRQAPGLRIQGVDVSSVALAGAVAKPETSNAAFYQAALERLPFPDAAFDYIASHEMIEHVEDPAVVVRELGLARRPNRQPAAL
jgi:ubiquinone/menaquinone biosynthesis C-methylase UbiE